jgi:hypothetical protein
MRRDKKPSGGGSSLGSIPKWVWLVAVVVVIAAVAAAGFAFSGGSSKSASTTNIKGTMVAAGCTYKDVKPFPPKDKANFHNDVPTLTSKVKWSTFPPAAGSHYGRWAVWGFYTTPVNPRQVVHNEEHGGVILWWGPKVPASTVDKLQTFYAASPAAMFGTPIAALGDKVAITAWTGNPAHYYKNGDYGIGHIAVCQGFDEAAFTKFRDAFRGKGPEGLPTSADLPGMGPQ